MFVVSVLNVKESNFFYIKWRNHQYIKIIDKHREYIGKEQVEETS